MTDSSVRINTCSPRAQVTQFFSSLDAVQAAFWPPDPPGAAAGAAAISSGVEVAKPTTVSSSSTGKGQGASSSGGGTNGFSAEGDLSAEEAAALQLDMDAVHDVYTRLTTLWDE